MSVCVVCGLANLHKCTLCVGLPRNADERMEHVSHKHASNGRPSVP